ncbi:hypothetical protein BC937DRAFT_91989 [Endogone sp. FLAS-F59071]|nr:hypothetical protein BC937DRAFT_91989 [Endogone sp. FLAS-F59071]|eukprot:RUS21643.1 hypothetical protein BC937DRAFT_91989 [Endogone sp. FLAS-F59071]
MSPATYESQMRANSATRDDKKRDDVLGEQNNQEEVEDTTDVEMLSTTNDSPGSLVIKREIISRFFLTKQVSIELVETLCTHSFMSRNSPRDEEANKVGVLSGSSDVETHPAPNVKENINLRTPLKGCQSSEREHEDDDGDNSSNSDDNEGCVALGTDFGLPNFTNNNHREGGWILESGEKVKDMLGFMTSRAIEQAKKSKKGNACALSVIKLGLSSIIDLSSEFLGGMHEWFGEHWPTLKAKALEHLDTTAKQFENPMKSDIQKIMEASRRKIDLRIVCREKDMDLSHSECARAVTRTKVTKDRSKCLRTNKCILDRYLMNNLSEEAVEDSAVLGLQFADLYGQVIGVDLLDNGLYFGFEGPAFRFPSQLCDVASLQQTLEVLYFFKPHHRKIDFVRATYFTPQNQ